MYCSIKSLSARRLIFLMLVLFVGFSVVPYHHGTVVAADKDIQLKRVAQEFLLVGRAQFKKGMYDAALLSLQKADEYREYLSGSQQAELDQLLSKVRANTYGAEQFNQKMDQVQSYVASGEYQKAMAVLKDLQSYETLTDSMRGKVSDKIDEVSMRIQDQRQRLETIYRDSVALYNEGDLKQARTGFEEIVLTGVIVGDPGMTASDYITRIDEQLAARQGEIQQQQSADQKQQQQAEQGSINVEDQLDKLQQRDKAAQPAPNKPQPVEMPQAKADDKITGGYIEVVNKQRQIQQSYTKAVVDDALSAAEKFRSNNEFEKAQAKVVQAQSIVNRNRLALGDELYKQYINRLDMVEQQISQQQQSYQEKVQQEKLEQGEVIAERFRRQQEAERQKRIAELLENARNFQKQQRYEEALKQIELLLAIDPQNDIALTSKMLLEDTINFRKQIAIREEINREEVGTYRNLLEATIPYDDDIVYSKNWREISAKRDTKASAGMTEEDMKVYEQLSKVVDLSALSPETQLSEAFDILRNSVTPPLSIVVKWNDLADNAFIEQTTPINMEGLPSVSVRKGLQLLLESVSGGLAELAYNVEEGVIVVGTRAQLQVKMVTEVYDITDQLLPQVDVSYDLGNISDLGESEEARGGGGGGGRGGTSEFDEETDAETDREENVQEIITTIMETIEPDSWYENGGEGTIRVYQDTQLIIRQTPEIHQQVSKLIDDLQKRFGMQVAIEARFLSVTEEFLENINLDMDVSYDFGGDLGVVDFFQDNLGGAPNPAGVASGVYGGTPGVLDDLQVSFLIDATQSNVNQRTLNAPKLTVMNGESATIFITQQQAYVGDYEFESISQGSDDTSVTVIADPTIYTIADGVALNITPTISADRKYVLLNIGSALSNVDLSKSATIPAAVEGGADRDADITLPLLDTTTVRTRVNVPDQGTLLIGGLKFNEETENEKGVPVLSKLPYFGRLFRNRNELANQRVLLILVKPTIIIKQEAEEQAMTTLED